MLGLIDRQLIDELISFVPVGKTFNYEFFSVIVVCNDHCHLVRNGLLDGPRPDCFGIVNDIHCEDRVCDC